ncbi:hypothetical protein [Fictibacillus enclensis]|uniref:hypothetical protein n=1 Tax=Fictibacillus enclensis TaxID=1017270 RepID=UPI0024BF55B6|nr:hypothetical protein [Fictibacillus enclensis]WHY71804.1 hypothetical protein QNH15_22855 [Fictibacillus enclensis]
MEEVQDEQFVQSDYYLQYNSLIQSQKLAHLLKKHDVIMNFYGHPKFMPYVTNYIS